MLLLIGLCLVCASVLLMRSVARSVFRGQVRHEDEFPDSARAGTEV